MLEYLNDINRLAGGADPNDRTIQRVAKIIAWECLKETFRPGDAKRDVILEELKSETNPEELLDYCERVLRLIYTTGVEKDRLRFALDPLAEYLAGLRLVDIYGANKVSWDSFFRKLDGACESKEQTREFLDAVRDCCLVKLDDKGFQSYVVAELEKRIF
ncbi:MAG: hypothetical protein AUI36_24865 [Cyanobacteria bacterium 13_1_40CM_2_61_4]|nr:MAG: hypothetical protein AUI36_24865 [Cyanobacteria bacterium 13_1_40CM_2_61_4]